MFVFVINFIDGGFEGIMNVILEMVDMVFFRSDDDLFVVVVRRLLVVVLLFNLNGFFMISVFFRVVVVILFKDGRSLLVGVGYCL